MGKVSSAQRIVKQKLIEQQDNFSGGMNLTEENVNLRDNESRLIDNFEISPMGSISKRTGSEVIYDMGYTIKTLNGWFQEEKRPNPKYVGNPSTPEFIEGIFHKIPKLEYENFIKLNKFLGHFTYEKSGSVEHYIATMLGIYDTNGDRINILDKEGNVNLKLPIDADADFKWDMQIEVESEGWYLYHVKSVLEKEGYEGQKFEIEMDGDKPKRYYIGKLGQLQNGAVSPDETTWWPVNPEGQVTLRWMKDAETPWDPLNPDLYKPKDANGNILSYANVGLETTIANIVNPPELTGENKVDGYFVLGGNDNRLVYQKLFNHTLDSNADSLWWVKNIVFDKEFTSQKLGHRLNPIYSKFVKEENTKTFKQINSIQYKDTCYVIMQGDIYTFKGGTVAKELVPMLPYKPTFEEYNMLKGNLLGALNPTTRTNVDNNYEPLWNWDWTQNPNETFEDGKKIPMVLGIMGNAIPQPGKRLSLRAVVVDARNNDDESDNKVDSTVWKYIWEMMVDSGDPNNDNTFIPLSGKPSSVAEISSILVPSTDTATITLRATLNGKPTTIEKEFFDGLEFHSPNTRAFFGRNVAERRVARYKNPLVHAEASAESLKIPEYGVNSSTLFSHDTWTADDFAAVYSGSGVPTMMLRVGLKLPRTLIEQIFYKDTVSVLDSLHFNSLIKSKIAKVTFDQNMANWTFRNDRGRAVAGAKAYLSFDSAAVSVAPEDKFLAVQNYMNSKNIKAKQQGDEYYPYNLVDRVIEDPTVPARLVSNYTDSRYNISWTNKIGEVRPNYRTVGELGGIDSNKRNWKPSEDELPETPFSPHGMDGLKDSDSGWVPSQHNIDIVKNNWAGSGGELDKWILTYLQSPLPETSIITVGVQDYRQQNDWGRGARDVYPFNHEEFSKINWAVELKKYESLVLGITPEVVEGEDPKEEIKFLGDKTWSIADLNSTDIILNICIFFTWVPFYKDKGYSGIDVSCYNDLNIKLESDGTGAGEGELGKFFTNSKCLVSSDRAGGGMTYRVSFPLNPINNIESYLPKMESIYTIRDINNSFIYKGQNFVWNTEKSIIFYSDINNLSYFPVIQTIELSDYPDEQIQAMHTFNDAALIFTKNRIYQLSGSNVEDFSVKLVNESVGVINPHTTKAVGNYLYFMSNKGAYRIRKGSMSTLEGHLIVEPIDTQIKGAYDPLSDEIRCTSEGINYYVHVLNRKESWVYNNETRVWTKQSYAINNEIKWFRNINNETYYVTDDFKICKFYSYSYRFKLDKQTNLTDILDLQSLYLDQFNKKLLLDENKKPLPGMEKYFKIDSNNTILGFNVEELVKDDLGYPIVSTFKSKEWSGFGDKVHHQKKFKEVQLKFSRDSYATGGWFQLNVDGNPVINPEYKDIELIDGEFQVVTKKTDYQLKPKDKSSLTRNPGFWLSRSFKVASGDYRFYRLDEDGNKIPTIWNEQGFEVESRNEDEKIDYKYPLTSKWQDTSESNMRRKKGKKGYSTQIVIFNDEQLPFGLKSLLLIYKLKKPK